MTEPQDMGAWHLDKRVPVALIFAIIIQTGTAVWWVGNLSNRVSNAVETNTRQDNRLSAIEAGFNAQAVNAATTAAQLTAMRDSLNELKAEQAETNRLLRGLATKGSGE